MNAQIVDQEADEKRKNYVLYKIVVNYNNHEWFVFRRYNEFSVLCDKLKKKFPHSGLKIPGKRLFGNLDPTFVKQRKEGLHDFVQKVMANPTLVELPEVREFLGIDKQIFLDEQPDEPMDVSEPKSPQASSPLPSDESFELGSSENKKARASDFEFLKVIGKGSFGKVFLSKSKADGKFFAVKVLSKEHIKRRNEVKHIMSERNVLVKSLRHPFLCSLHYSFQTSQKLYFVLDYINGGELFFHLQRERFFPENRAKFYAAEMASALGYLHSQNIIYRDLKPENILLDAEGHVVLTDFGLCKEGIEQTGTTSTFCGTPEYLAPEVLRKEPYDRAVDWWCLGSVLYEMLFGLPPFYSRDTAEMYQNILHRPLRLKTTCSPTASSIIIGLLKKDRRDRLGSVNDFEDIKNHDFFRSINWTELLERKAAPPFNPRVNHAADTRNIDPEFTREAVPQSVGKSVDSNAKFSASVVDDGDAFVGFTYKPPIDELAE